jgi:hypothetical protein
MGDDKAADLSVLLTLEMMNNADVDPADYGVACAGNVHHVVTQRLEGGDSRLHCFTRNGVTQFVGKPRSGFRVGKRYLANQEVFH